MATDPTSSVFIAANTDYLIGSVKQYKDDKGRAQPLSNLLYM